MAAIVTTQVGEDEGAASAEVPVEVLNAMRAVPGDHLLWQATGDGTVRVRRLEADEADALAGIQHISRRYSQTLRRLSES